MKKYKLFAFLVIAFTLCQGFMTLSPNYIGTFGVTNDDPSDIKLTIQENGNFFYQDFSNPNHKIKVEGTWTLKHNYIILNCSESIKFHYKWKFNTDGTIAKSRKGISFYTLCKI